MWRERLQADTGKRREGRKEDGARKNLRLQRSSHGGFRRLMESTDGQIIRAGRGLH